LFQRLGAAGRVTQVSATAGSGKTYLLRSWLQAAGLIPSAAWVSVGPDEHDALRFWMSTVNALRQTTAGSAMRTFTPASGLDGWSVVERLLEDLASLRDRIWLVIDDAHELHSGDAARQFELLLMRSPPEMRFVLVTRHDLQLGLHRLRLESELTEIRAADLRFTGEEARALFASAGVDLSDRCLEGLVERTEGWAAGLRLAALSLVGYPDPERFVAEFSGSERTVAEYLLAEVLDRQSEEVRRMLLRTSILQRVNGPLADALTGGTDGERILLELEQANAFVVALDARRSWFRYHQLFAELLQFELRRTEPDVVASLREKAAVWYAEHGYPVEAVRQAQAGRNWSLATRVLSDHWVSLLIEGYTSTAIDLADALPAERAAANAELAVVIAMRLMHRSLQEAEPYLGLAARGVDRLPAERRGHVRQLLTLARLYLARLRGDVPGLVEEAERLLAPDAAGKASSNQDLRLMALTSLGDAELSTDRLDEAEHHLAEGVDLARRAGRPLLELDGRSHWAMAACMRSPSVAAERARRAVELARQHGWQDEPTGSVAYVALVVASVWQGRLEDADRWLAQADRTVPVEAHLSAGALLNCGRGWLELARGRPEEAIAAFRSSAQQGALLAAPYASWAECFSLQARLRAGDVATVEQTLAKLDDHERDTVGMRIVLAMLRLSQDDADGTAAALAPVLDGTMAVGRPWDVQVFLLGAIACDAAGEAAGAERALERALDLAEPEGLLLPFLLHRVPRLLERRAQRRTAHGGLIAEIRGTLTASTPPAPAASDRLLEPLSESENRVLRYLPTNLTAPEIARELHLSVNTVRTHMRHLYDKLGVHRRQEAVELARALGLIAPSSRQP
jgi:LuxR family maltose regulon positive regulatory protein